MPFEYPHSLYALLLIPLIVAAICIYRRRVRSGMVYSSVALLAAGTHTWRVHAARLLPLLVLIGCLLAIIALMRPRSVLSRINQTSEAIAIGMTVDVSGSMDALDLSDMRGGKIVKERTRLDVVKETFAAFIKQRSGDLIGLISFGGYATTRTPLTLDHNAVLHVLDGVSVPKHTVGKDGALLNPDEARTAIGDALATACARLQHAPTQSRIVVLLSDGVSNAGIIQPEEAMDGAKKLGIKVYTIGIGSRGPAFFAIKDAFNQKRYVRQPVEFDAKLLQRIAETTGGQYFNVSNEKGLEQALADINELEKTEIDRNVLYRHRELFPFFLWPGLALITLGTTLNMLIARRIV